MTDGREKLHRWNAPEASKKGKKNRRVNKWRPTKVDEKRHTDREGRAETPQKKPAKTTKEKTHVTSKKNSYGQVRLHLEKVNRQNNVREEDVLYLENNRKI